MIVVKLQGALGNQLFQYSIGRFLALKNKTILKLDATDYQNKSYRKYMLTDFNIKAKIATIGDLSNYIYIPNWYEIFVSRIFNKNIYSQFISKYNFVEKSLYKYDKNVLSIDGNYYLSGFWQNEKYFKSIRNELLKEITLRNQSELETNKVYKDIVSNNSVSIHVRRGDYLKKTESYGLCPLEYYKNSVKFLSLKHTNLKFYVFTDDSTWVKTNFGFLPNACFVSDYNLSDQEELILMSKCKHNIIANSTYSWWGAWLNNNRNKIIIAPENWLKNSNLDASDLIPSSWVKM